VQLNERAGPERHPRRGGHFIPTVGDGATSRKFNKNPKVGGWDSSGLVTVKAWQLLELENGVACERRRRLPATTGDTLA